MSKELEIERTYLASGLPDDLPRWDCKEIIDIYIPESSDFPLVRLRKTGETYVITKKQPVKEGDYSRHIEHHVPLTKEEFDALAVTSNKSLRKKRYSKEFDTYHVDIDVFEDGLRGLALVDLELASDDVKIKVPNYCLLDVTQERAILGGQLAGKSMSDIRPWLEKNNYRDILA